MNQSNDPLDRARTELERDLAAELDVEAGLAEALNQRPVCPVCGSTRIHVEFIDASTSGRQEWKIPGLMECLDCSERRGGG